MKNRLGDLRNHLFETIEMLKDEEKPMDIKRAQAIKDVAQTVINSAKLEIEFMELVGCKGSGFLEPPEATPALEQKPVLRLRHG